MFNDYWQGLGRSSRVGLVFGSAAIMAGTIALAVWLLRTDYEVLFSTLSPQDAAAMTAELDRMKVPYKIDADGSSILVDKSSVHQTRLKLMGKDIPLHGAVGFELFNNTDFGMTEFAQKINYQRAMQGEITRTIMSLAEVQSARVHLALPEDGLFKREKNKAKASITVALKHGQALRREQVTGIQRLVSASVTGISPEDVTIVDQQGVALTRSVSADGESEPSARLELKQQIERHLSRKASEVLDRTFGAGRALASVDVVLDMNQVRVTTEDVTGPAREPGDVATGVIVRERETLKDDASAAGQRDGAAAASSHRETDYQVGRRVEQVVTQPGSVQRLQVLAVVKAPLDRDQLEQLRTLIGAAVGASRERGDTVVVQSMDSFTKPSIDAMKLHDTQDDEVAPGQTRMAAVASPASRDGEQPVDDPSTRLLIALSAAVLMATAALAWTLGRLFSRRSRSPGGEALTPQQREVALARVRHWLNEPAAAGSPTPGGSVER